MESGTFIKNFKDYIIFIYEIKGNQLKDIRIYQPQKDRPVHTIVAKSGEFIVIPEQQIIKLRLYNGSSDEPDFDNPNRFFKLNFKTYEVTLNLKDYIQKIDKKPKDMNIDEIKQEIVSIASLFPFISSVKLVDETDYSVKYRLLINDLIFKVC